ncbi:VWA domain-containing protein [Thiomonas sp. X19]|uniref:VWA domain-containing protein n=1 Tax=Thiomonas sp. X19 TaxID=1050370 RepID=UPI001314BAAE|nr:VWA domain-containing protein [Thiomonas sp. X19]
MLWLLLAASLAGPRQPLAQPRDGMPQNRHLVNVMVVLDASPSMAATDAQGLSLMERARIVLQDLLPTLRGERLGLVIYGQGAGILLPCTDDMAIFRHALQQADPALLHDQQGAGLPGALELARRELAATPGSSRAVLLVAGADPGRPASQALRKQLLAQARSLHAAHVPVYALMLKHMSWLGTSASALDSTVIETLARETGGKTANLGDAPWQALYAHGLARLPSNPVPPGDVLAWREFYGVPLLGAMALLMLLSWPAGGRLRRTPTSLAAGLFLVLGASMILSTNPAHAQTVSPSIRYQAWLAWHATRYAQAWQLYAALPGYDARMGEGDSAYRLGDYPQALAAFRRAMLDADSDAHRAQALYNLGNAAFHIPGALREAIDAYTASLVLSPGNPAALRNLRLAEAQWRLEHPENALTGIRKRGAASYQSAFGQTSERSPSQMRNRPKRQDQQPQADQLLQSGGQLRPQASGVQVQAVRPGRSLADTQAAQRKMQLLEDHAPQLLGGLLEQDNRRALQALEPAP